MRSVIYHPSAGSGVSIAINPDPLVKLMKLPLALTWFLQRRLVFSNLAGFRIGRIVLHLLCVVRTGHLLWHWHGILRELHS